MALKRKGAVYSVVALMLCVAVYLNWSYGKQEEEGFSSVADFHNSKMLGEAALVDGKSGDIENGESQLDEDYFSEARLSRQQARDEAVSILNMTIENEATSQEASAQASASVQVMAEAALQESRIENMIIAKGYKDCVVFVNENGVNVIISKLENGLQDSDIAKITEIVIEESGFDASKIKIVETA